ncbi:MAG TPA: FMN-binding negative transcriptional regulator [Thermoleophilaceae bacterium]|nr:FMN-binding negative transcriptional regulator [Thermoleophilaceae bacterium]
MYVPGYQSEQDPERLWEAIRRHSFGSLICADDEGRPVSTQLPFIRRDERFLTHLAAANPQSRLVADGRPVLCQFLGPHAYVSPAWYKESGHVPTWNYVQVVVSGHLVPLDRDGARFVVEETVREHEQRRDDPVTPEQMAERIDQLLDGIRAFEVIVEDITGRFKLSQNRSVSDRRRIVTALRAGDASQRGVADLMEGADPTEPPRREP